jgi:hypothetical protein
MRFIFGELIRIDNEIIYFNNSFVLPYDDDEAVVVEVVLVVT